MDIFERRGQEIASRVCSRLAVCACFRLLCYVPSVTTTASQSHFTDKSGLMLYPLVKNSQIRPLDIWMSNVTVLLICSQESLNRTNLLSGTDKNHQESKSGYCTRLSWMWLIEDGISFSYFCVLSRHVQSEGWRLAEPDPRESKQHDATSPWPHPQSLSILKVAMAAQPVSTGLVQQPLCQDASIVVGRPPCGQASFAGRKSKRRRCLPAKTLHRICIVWPFGQCDQFWFFFLVVPSQTSQANHKPWHSQASVQLGWVTAGSKRRRYNTQQLHWKGSSKRIQRRRLRAQEISGEWSSVLRFSSSDGNSGNRSIGLKVHECFIMC